MLQRASPLLRATRDCSMSPPNSISGWYELLLK
jgi:hypothetical protein